MKKMGHSDYHADLMGDNRFYDETALREAITSYSALSRPMALGKIVRPRFSLRNPLFRLSMALVVYMTFEPSMIIIASGAFFVILQNTPHPEQPP